MKNEKKNFCKPFFAAISLVAIFGLVFMVGCSCSSSDETTFIVNGVSFKMVKVEGGEFEMGATSELADGAEDNEVPVHKVNLSDFQIGETEVTQELWEAVMGSNPSYFKGPKRPVECVSWDDCQEFILKLNELTGKKFRLPSEAEWEFAARGGNLSKGFKYSGSNELDLVAWYEDNSEEQTHPVAQKLPNELGIFDLSGNVEEWCADWFGDYGASAQTNPKGPSSGEYRIIRGGGFNFIPSFYRVSCRFGYEPSAVLFSYGLRLAL